MLSWFARVASLLACANVALASHTSSLGPLHLSRRAVSCSKTADCTAAGVPIPTNSHQFCMSGSCSFSGLHFFRFPLYPPSSVQRSNRVPTADSLCTGCNTNYSLVSGACVKTVTSTTTTSSCAELDNQILLQDGGLRGRVNP